MSTAVRVYATRDSATAVLRRMGIGVGDYNKFMAKASDGSWDCYVLKAEQYLISLNHKSIAETGNLTGRTRAKPKASRAPETKKVSRLIISAETSKNSKISLAEAMRQLVVAGKDNLEIFNELKDEYNLTNKQRGYPAWYRSDLRRRGIIKEE